MSCYRFYIHLHVDLKFGDSVGKIGNESENVYRSCEIFGENAHLERSSRYLNIESNESISSFKLRCSIIAIVVYRSIYRYQRNIKKFPRKSVRILLLAVRTINDECIKKK